MLNKLAIQSLVASAVFGLALAFSAGPASAGSTGCDLDSDEDGICDNKDRCPDVYDPTNVCKPPTKVICHNIGGPRDLGANCDMTGNCSYALDGGGAILVTPNNFLGIIIGFNQDSAGALAAHIAHGDGWVSAVFDPPLHLASVIGPHRASNVECLATRINPQPEEPGN